MPYYEHDDCLILSLRFNNTLVKRLHSTSTHLCFETAQPCRLQRVCLSLTTEPLMHLTASFHRRI